MEISKKAIHYRIDPEPSIEAKKQVLQSTISSIEMLKTTAEIKRLEKNEREIIDDIQKRMEEIGKNINNFIATLPREEEIEERPLHKKIKARAGKKKEKLVGLKQFDEELREIKVRLSRLA